MTLLRSCLRPALAAFGLAFGAAIAFAQTAVPSDEAAFARVAAERIQREVPDFRISPSSRLSLESRSPSGEVVLQLNLDRIHAFCAKNADGCDEALGNYAKAIGQTLRDRARPIEPAMVRVAIRPMSYVESIRKQLNTTTAVLYARPLPGDLAAVAMLDFERSARFVGQADLAKLGVDEAGLFRLGGDNLRKGVRPLLEAAPIPGPRQVGTISGEDYATSRILFHADWKALSDKMNGYLLVMLPTADTILYGDGSTAEGFDALQALGNDLAKQAERPLSRTMLRWTPGGWEEVK